MNEKISGLIAALTDFAENLNEKTLGSLVDDGSGNKSETGNQDWNQRVKKDQQDRDDRLAKQIAIELDKIITKPKENNKARSTQPKEGDTVSTEGGKAGKVTKPTPQSKKATPQKPDKKATTSKPTETLTTTTKPIAKTPPVSRRIQSTISSVAITDISKSAAKTIASIIPKDKIPAAPIKPKEESSWLKKLIVPVLLGIGGVLAMINGLMSDGVGEDTGISKILSKIGITGGVKLAAKLFGGPALKVTGKLFGWVTKVLKPVVSKIPVIGSMISWAFAWKRIQEGDYVGGIIDIASGIATLFPGVGTAIAVGLDVLNAWLDYSDAGQEMKKNSNFTLAAFTTKIATWAAKAVKPVLKRLPLIGTAISFKAGWDRLQRGDVLGGVLDFASGVAVMLPGIGTAISIGMDVLQMWMDNSETGKEFKENSGFTIAAFFTKAMSWAAKAVGPVLRKLPVIGTALSFKAGWDKMSEGDILGGVLDFASGIAVLLPGPGTAIAIGLDVIGLFLNNTETGGSIKSGIVGGISFLWDGITQMAKDLKNVIGEKVLSIIPETFGIRAKVANLMGINIPGSEKDEFGKAMEAEKRKIAESLAKTGLSTDAITKITKESMDAAEKAGGNEYEDRVNAMKKVISSSKGSMRKFKENLSDDQRKNIEDLAKQHGTTFDKISAQMASMYKKEGMFSDDIDDKQEELFYSMSNTAAGLQLAREKKEAGVQALLDEFNKTGARLGSMTMKLDKAGKISKDQELTTDMWIEIERLEKSSDQADKMYLESLEKIGLMDRIRSERAASMAKAEYDPTITESKPLGKLTPTNEIITSESKSTGWEIKSNAKPLSGEAFKSLKYTLDSNTTQDTKITGGGSRTRTWDPVEYKKPRDPIKPIQPTVGTKFTPSRLQASQKEDMSKRLGYVSKEDKLAAMSLERQLIIENQNLHKAKSFYDLNKADPAMAEELLKMYTTGNSSTAKIRGRQKIDLLMKANLMKGYTDFQLDEAPEPKMNQSPDMFDFIWRPGQEPMTFSKGDILIGSHQDNITPSTSTPTPPAVDKELLNRVDKMVELMSEHSTIQSKVLEVLTESGLMDKQGDTVVNNGGNTSVVNNMVADNNIMNFRDRVVGRLSNSPNK